MCIRKTLAAALLFHLICLFPSCRGIDSETTNSTTLHANSPGAQLQEGDIRVDLKTNKTSYRSGENVQISLKASHRCSVKIWSEDRKGKRTVIWPIPGSKTPPLLQPGQTLNLPGANDSWKLVASKPYGINTLVAEATGITKPSPVLVGTDAATEPASDTAEFFVNRQREGTKPRGLQMQSTSPSSSAAGLKGTARWLYEVKTP